MQEQVDKRIITERALSLRELEKKLADKFKKQFVGEIAQVLIENEVRNSGRCERYYEISVAGERPLAKGEIVKCKINEDAITAVSGNF
jgi:tRNA A37 methylthiotransferase MiaB